VVNESAAERHVGIAALHEEMCAKLKTAVVSVTHSGGR
jgi:hypothetical protein